MRATPISAFFAASSIVAGSVISTPISNVFHWDYALTSEAMVIDPVVNQEWTDAATSLYLDPLGFNGVATTLTIPEVIAGMTYNKLLGLVCKI